MLDEQNELYETFYKSENLNIIVKNLVLLDNNDQFKKAFTISLYDKNSHLNSKFKDIEFLKYLTYFDSEELSEFVINHAYFNQETFIALNEIKHKPFSYNMCETFTKKFLTLQQKKFNQANFTFFSEYNNLGLNLK